MLLWSIEPKIDLNRLLPTIQSKNLVAVMIVSNSVGERPAAAGRPPPRPRLLPRPRAPEAVREGRGAMGGVQQPHHHQPGPQGARPDAREVAHHPTPLLTGQFKEYLQGEPLAPRPGLG